MNVNIIYITLCNCQNFTWSPPEAKETLGISCLAIVSPPSNAAKVIAREETVRATLEPEWDILGFAASALAAAWQTRLFLSADLRPAAAHTLAIHSL